MQVFPQCRTCGGISQTHGGPDFRICPPCARALKSAPFPRRLTPGDEWSEFMLMQNESRRCSGCQKMPALERLLPAVLCADCFEYMHVNMLLVRRREMFQELSKLDMQIHKNVALLKGPSPSSLYGGENYKCQTCDFSSQNFVLASLHVEENDKHRIEFLRGKSEPRASSPRPPSAPRSTSRPTHVSIDDL